MSEGNEGEHSVRACKSLDFPEPDEPLNKSACPPLDTGKAQINISKGTEASNFAAVIYQLGEIGSHQIKAPIFALFNA